MEKLEKTALESNSIGTDCISSKDDSEKKPYEGLNLLEEGSYKGSTSIKYWM